MALAAQLSFPADRAERRDVSIDATMRKGRKPIDIVISDLSASGFGSSVDHTLTVGEIVAIGASSIGVRDARVAWAAGNEYGFEFIQTLSHQEAADAENIDTVHRPGFGVFSERLVSAAPISTEARLPLRIRVALIVGCSAALWMIIIMAARFVAYLI